MSVFSNRSIDPTEERARYAAAILDLLADQNLQHLADSDLVWDGVCG